MDDNSRIAQAFNFDRFTIRFVEGKPVANDVAKALGFKSPSDAVYRLVKDAYKGICDLQTPGGIQSATVLEEAGIYQLIFCSKLPSAEKFQQWVFEEVLPSIRKAGSYHGKPSRNDRASLKPKSTTPKQTASLVLFISKQAKLSPEVGGQLAIQAVTIAHPDLATALKPLHQTLIDATASPDNLLTATQIGVRLDLSGQKVNKLLIEKKLQVKNENKSSQKEAEYIATELGRKHSAVVQTAISSGSTTQQLRWKESVVELLGS